MGPIGGGPVTRQPRGIPGQYASQPTEFQGAENVWNQITGGMNDVESRALAASLGSDPYQNPGFGGVASSIAGQFGWNDRDASKNAAALESWLQDYGVTNLGMDEGFWNTPIEGQENFRGVNRQVNPTGVSMPAAGMGAGVRGASGQAATITPTTTPKPGKTKPGDQAQQIATQKGFRTAVEDTFNGLVAGLDEGQIGEVIAGLGGNPYSPDPMKDLTGTLIKKYKLEGVKGQDLVDTLNRIIRVEGAKYLPTPDPVEDTFGGQNMEWVYNLLDQMTQMFGSSSGGTATASPDFTQALLDAFSGKTYET